MNHNLEVLIPVKERKSLAQTIYSLLPIELIDLITIISGDYPIALPTNLVNHQKIRILDLSKYPFHKSYYLNRGIKESLGRIILISDADIIWKTSVIQQLYSLINSQVDSIAYPENVRESKPQTFALKRVRLSPIIIKNADHDFTLKIEEQPLTSFRPGCGLICTHRQTLIDLGGYNEDLKGWGWEDQDLLIRAEILGYQLFNAGTVLHLSHSELMRNQSELNPLLTRNHNIILSCRAIASGKVRGNLAKRKNAYSIKFELPPFLEEML